MDRRSFLKASTAGVLAHGLLGSAEAGQTGNAPSATAPDLMQRLQTDPLRPQFHLVPQAGFVGDPCAPRYFNGNYHIFFHGSYGGRGWAHAMSPDLLHWRHLPIALAPGDGSYDSYGTFTGSVLPGTDAPTVIYAGVTKVPRERETIRAEGLREVQCIATSNDPDLRTWRKLPHPVIDGPPPGIKVTGFRDPFGWKDNDTWYVGVGSGFPQVGGNVMLYSSKDARRFDYLHPLAQGTWNGKSFTNPVGSAEMWECPDFFPIGDKHVLIYSTEYITYWEVGSFDRRELKFHSRRKGYLDHGAYYAPKTMLDGQGRRLLWGWVQETRPRESVEAAGWSGAISLPRILSVGPDDALLMDVPPEFSSLRKNVVDLQRPATAEALAEGLARAVIHNRAGEVVCRFAAGIGDCGLELSAHPSEGSSLFRIGNGVPIGETPSILVGDRTLPLTPDKDGVSTLHLWFDGSILELFVDSRQAMTVRLYMVPIGSGDLFVRWTGAAGSLKSLMVADIAPVSSDRLTT
jgi:beta-fructofuranosidase